MALQTLRSFPFRVFLPAVWTGAPAHARCAYASGEDCAIEWRDGKVIELGDLPGSVAVSAYAVNDVGLSVGVSYFPDGTVHATEWSGSGRVMDMESLPGSTLAAARDINDAGEIVEFIDVGGGLESGEVEWRQGY